MSVFEKLFVKKEYRKANTRRKYHPVAVLLRCNPGIAFTVEEIVSRTNMNKNTIRSMLRKLEKEGRVVHRAPYFGWKK